MSMELDRICTVDISLATPISDNASFDNILILGPAPAKSKGSIEAVAAYSGLDGAHRSRSGCHWRKR